MRNLPAPVLPTTPTLLPGGTLNDSLSSARGRPSLYRRHTFRNSNRPSDGHDEGGTAWSSSIIIGRSVGRRVMASTRSTAVIADSASAKVSTRNPRVIVKFADQMINRPTDERVE
jgi:hypothetical protein